MVSVGRQSISPACAPLYLMNVALMPSLSSLGFFLRLSLAQAFAAVGSSTPDCASPTSKTSRCLHRAPRRPPHAFRFCVQQQKSPFDAIRHAWTRDGSVWLFTTPV